MDLVRKSLIEKGFSEDVAERAANPQRKSTIANYEGIWSKYVGWLDSRGTPDPTKTTVQLLVLYLEHLRKEGKALSTILSTKSAIVKTVHQITGVSLAESGTLGDLIKNLKINNPSVKLKFPKWYSS